MKRWSVYVKNDKRLDEVKTFIRQNMPSARFEYNPYKTPNGNWNICFSCTVDDRFKMDSLFVKYYEEDEAEKKRLDAEKKSKTLWGKVCKFLNWK